MPDLYSIFDSVSAYTGLQIRRFTLAVAVLSVAAPLYATEQDDKDSRIEEIVVTVDLDSLPNDGVRSMFGFNKSLLETPRSASSVSEEMMDRFIVRDIDEMIALAPGSFTQSFFGVAGTLDIRGTPGETYFRGVRRLDNPGNYPTPLGASSRVDIVRGPASPIHGPSKIGGYINFNPKSARIEESGEFITEATGTIGVDIGSWDRRVVSAELGGPGQIGDQDFGYWLYGLVEDSGSYYRNSKVKQKLLQISFDLDVGNVQFQFGGMYHDFAGNQIAGWNRLTQDLVDHGTYITGLPAAWMLMATVTSHIRSSTLMETGSQTSTHSRPVWFREGHRHWNPGGRFPILVQSAQRLFSIVMPTCSHWYPLAPHRLLAIWCWLVRMTFF